MENEWKVIQNWVGHLFSATNDMHKKYFEDFPKNKKRFQAQNVTEATLTKTPIVYRCQYVLLHNMKYIYLS